MTMLRWYLLYLLARPIYIVPLHTLLFLPNSPHGWIEVMAPHAILNSCIITKEFKRISCKYMVLPLLSIF
jgi:hypothetical protein